VHTATTPKTGLEETVRIDPVIAGLVEQSTPGHHVANTSTATTSNKRSGTHDRGVLYKSAIESPRDLSSSPAIHTGVAAATRPRGTRSRPAAPMPRPSRTEIPRPLVRESRESQDHGLLTCGNRRGPSSRRPRSTRSSVSGVYPTPSHHRTQRKPSSTTTAACENGPRSRRRANPGGVLPVSASSTTIGPVESSPLRKKRLGHLAHRLYRSCFIPAPSLTASRPAVQPTSARSLSPKNFCALSPGLPTSEGGAASEFRPPEVVDRTAAPDIT
jgi:hypothetical protein